ncbi:hypothetical protein AncyloWKF20_02060 [Ancylobacter sp. WKF20]|nr:hypothetical protein [Ancylobacter sp. WKF20]WGD30648.1 hypothetical protein AncyloWKF20_02060 [Ancylobacter sp. WKF20]
MADPATAFPLALMGGEQILAGPPYSGITKFRLVGESRMFHENFGGGV